jgi:integrase
MQTAEEEEPAAKRVKQWNGKVRHQQGHIFKAGKAFHVRYYVTTLGKDGKTIRKQKSTLLCHKDARHYSATCKEVKDATAKFMEKINKESGVVVTAEDMTVVDFFDKEYLPYYEKDKKPASARTMRQIFDSLLREHFGTITLRGYRASMARTYLNSLKVDRSNSQLHAIKGVARAIFSEAINRGKFPEDAEINPWRSVKIEETWGRQLEETKHYTLEEAENITNALVDHVDCQLAFALGAFNAFRHGEIRGLQWDDIDGTWIHIRRSVDDLGNIVTPKTKASMGKVPLLPSVRVYLELWRKKWKGIGPWVLSETPEPVYLTNMANRVIKPTLKKAAAEALAAGDKHKAETLKWKAWHSGRRGAITFAAQEGNFKLAQMLARHADASITLQAYDKEMPDKLFLEGMLAVDAKRLKS